MGQHLCVLKSLRVADKDVLPPEAECAVSTSNEMIGVKSSLMGTSSDASHFSRASGTEPARMTLPRLPTEIILDLVSYLPPSSYMSLSYSCQTICTKMGASITHILGDTAPMRQSSASALSTEVRNTRFLERWELLCMLNRDGKLPLSKAFCGGCEQAHNCSEFGRKWPAELAKERHCSSTAGLVWICPRQILEYGQATISMARARHECESTASYIGGTSCSHIVGYGGYDMYITHWPVMRVAPSCVPSSEEVIETLGPLNAPVCPHLRLNDAHVASAYSPDLPLRWGYRGGTAKDCQGDNCLPRLAVVCNLCSTEILFGIQDQYHGPETQYITTETLNITIVRRFTKVQSCTDRVWIRHAADPADFEEYARAWQASVAECRRKVGLLYPP